jgi:nucleotide-binding universal stress UspA family protein
MLTARIFVATDLSESSAIALREAHTRAGADGALMVCHVRHSWRRVNALFPQLNRPSPRADRARDQRARDAVAAFVRTVIGRDPGEYALSVPEGDPAAEVVRRAEEWNAELVVAGSHGATGLPRMRLGSVAEEIVRLAHCPVLVTRPPAGSRIVVGGTDFSDGATPALTVAAEEAARTGGRAVFVHSVEWPLVLDTQFVGWTAVDTEAMVAAELELRQRLEAVVAAGGLVGEARITRGEAERALVREAVALAADLLVVGTHGRTGLSRIVLGSVAEFVVRTAPCSVLVVRLHGSS